MCAWAEEFGFATAPLVVLGCIMMRVCHKDTCPVGVATQNKDLRALYRGKAHHVVNFMHFIAQELREILASLGLKRVEDLVGRTDLLQRSSTLKANSKAASIDVEKLLCPFDGPNTKEIQQNHNLEHGFDLTNLYEVTKPYIAEGRRYTGSFTVNNEQRDVGLLQVVRFRNNMEKQDFLKIQLMFIRMVMLVKVLQHMRKA